MTDEPMAHAGPDLEAVEAAFLEGTAVDASKADVRLVVDGAHPFLVVVRDGPDADALDRLIRGEASSLRAGEGAPDEEVRQLVRRVVSAGVAAHGSFLVVELWSGDRMKVLGPDGPAPATVRALAAGLARMETGEGHPGGVVVEASDDRHPPDRTPLLTIRECHELGALLLGVVVPRSLRSCSAWPGSSAPSS